MPRLVYFVLFLSYDKGYRTGGQNVRTLVINSDFFIYFSIVLHEN